MSNEKQQQPPSQSNEGTATEQNVPQINSAASTNYYGSTTHDLEIQNAGVNMTQRQPQRDSTIRFDDDSSSDLPKKHHNVDIEEQHGTDDGIDWKPGFSYQFPWIGFAGLITIIVATCFAIGVLVASNHERVKDWPYASFPIQPNVLLNICNQLGNLGLLTVVGQGLAIAWWRKAMRGSSLKTLHQNHAYSYSFFAIITSGKRFNIVALAALMTKFAVIDSTLFQKATKTIVTMEREYTNATVTAWMETKWPVNKGGVPGGETGTVKTIDTAWANVIDAYSKKIANGKLHDSLNNYASFFDCPYQQECSGIMQGLGFSFNCSSTIEDIDYGLQHKNSQGNGTTPYPLWKIDFTPSFATTEKPYANVNLDMMYVDSHNGTEEGSCPGTLTRRRCEIRPALVEYPVTVMVPSKKELEGGNIVVHVKFFENKDLKYPYATGLDGVEQIDRLKVLKHDDLNEKAGSISTVGALTYVLNNLYRSSANLTYDNDWDIQVQGGPAQTTFYADKDNEDFSRCWYDIDNKRSSDDPAVEILRKLNTLSFVTGLYLSGAPATNANLRAKAGMAYQKFETSVGGIVEQYETNYNYMGGAIVATFVTLLLVLPVYWGFWQLGRRVTLGPLEIANAFNAPIVMPSKTKSHHGDFDEVLQDVGERRVQYGQLLHAPPGQLGIAEPHQVRRPDFRHSMNLSANKKKVGFGIGAALGGITAAAVGAART
ncbi:hypothetical protein B0J11DRAFT_585269 [Dendryphion nanum]|uniref:Uncharacterized protein n=1 Tax=Dendryphion nanum TaxID=256645 RepID=A0A9P9IAU3_9PLEO|nr:hypothetical protein B0J11DRAFT_585269 [Dendryphion nanum]